MAGVEDLPKIERYLRKAHIINFAAVIENQKEQQ
jgi:hypothetical protein